MLKPHEIFQNSQLRVTVAEQAATIEELKVRLTRLELVVKHLDETATSQAQATLNDAAIRLERVAETIANWAGPDSGEAWKNQG